MVNKKIYSYQKSQLKALKGWAVPTQRQRVKAEAKKQGNTVKETKTSFNVYKNPNAKPKKKRFGLF